MAVNPGFRRGRLLTTVASTRAYAMSRSSETASKSGLKIAARTQSRYRLKTVFQEPKAVGGSRHGLPVRAYHSIPGSNHNVQPRRTPKSQQTLMKTLHKKTKGLY